MISQKENAHPIAEAIERAVEESLGGRIPRYDSNSGFRDCQQCNATYSAE